MTQLLQNAVYGTALILAAAILRRALGGRLIPEVRLTLWGLCLIRLLAPVFPDSGLSLWGLLPRTGTASTAAPGIDPLPVPSGAAGNLPNLTTPAPGTAPVSPGFTPVEPAGAAFPWETVLLSVWIGVGLLLAARYALSWSRTRRAVADAVLLGRDDPRYGPLPKCARLREGVMDGAPLTFGAARPTVVLSPGLSGEALECVLAHEGVHARRRDNLWHYAMALALVLYWWNPAVWLMARLLRRDIELACDRAAVKRLGAEKRTQYAQTLVSMATVAEGPAFCQTFGRKAAEERILSVMKFKKTTVLGAVLSLTLVAGVTVAFASGPKAPAGQNGDPSNNTPYQVCADPLCTVDYQHCHIDGEVVRAYDEYPGLLCARPDCGIEEPHEHDGVQYAGKAGKYVILDELQGAKCDIKSGNVTEYTVNLDILRQNLDRHVAEGTMTQAEADRVWEQAQEFAQGGKALTWAFQGDSGLTLDELHNVCYRDENGKLIPIDPATVASGFIFPAGEDGDPAPANTSPLIVEDGDPDVAPPRPVTLEEYEALLKDLVSGGKLSQEDADWLLAGATKGMEGQECPYLWVVDGGSYAVMGGNICTLAGCGDNSRHTHDGEWYTGWTGKTTIPPLCADEGCAVSGTHYHGQNGEAVHCYSAAPALLPVCPVEGCTIWGAHTHDGVAYRCSGGHSGGVCDGNCHNVGDGGGAVPTEEKIPEFVPNYDPSTEDSIGMGGESAIQPVSSGHHGDSHHGNGYHGGHH